MQLPVVCLDNGLDCSLMQGKLDKAVASFLVQLDLRDGPIL